MKTQQLEVFAREAPKSIKTKSDLNDFRQMLSKVTIETALNAEFDEKHGQSPSGNKRNGTTTKQLRTEDGQLSIEAPRDRDGTFEPQLVKKMTGPFYIHGR